jgi:hypothetical protein
MITALALIVLARLSTSAKPPAIIIIRITARLKEDDHNDNLLLSFSYSWVFLYSSVSQIPFNFSGRVSDHIEELRWLRYLSIINPVIGIIRIRKKIKLCIDWQSIKKRSRTPF